MAIPPHVLYDEAIIVAFVGKLVLQVIKMCSSPVTNFTLNMDSSMKKFIGISDTIRRRH